MTANTTNWNPGNTPANTANESVLSILMREASDRPQYLNYENLLLIRNSASGHEYTVVADTAGQGVSMNILGRINLAAFESTAELARRLDEFTSRTEGNDE